MCDLQRAVLERDQGWWASSTAEFDTFVTCPPLLCLIHDGCLCASLLEKEHTNKHFISNRKAAMMLTSQCLSLCWGGLTVHMPLCYTRLR